MLVPKIFGVNLFFLDFLSNDAILFSFERYQRSLIPKTNEFVADFAVKFSFLFCTLLSVYAFSNKCYSVIQQVFI